MVEFYFLLQHNETHEKHWHYDSDGNKTYTMLKNDNPLMEGFRNWELKEVASSSGEKTPEPPSFENAVLFLAGFQIADDKIQQGLQY